VTPFEQKCQQAAARLHDMADQAHQSHGERNRLLGKAEGLRLALSYLRDYPHEGEADS
jgi:hypothetical protein